MERSLVSGEPRVEAIKRGSVRKAVEGFDRNGKGMEKA